jgi:cytosine/adenosine deaminase-related metal-dependent hydrolase
MIFNNVTTINSNGPVNIQLKNGAMTIVNGNNPTDALQINFDNDLVFEGLINWHDHLDFNLFPQLGDKIYNNYTEWGDYIHTHYKDEIAAVLKVPLPLRIRWGLYKNLLGGVITVVNHGEQLNITDALINVVQCHSIHSVQFERWWKFKLNNPLKIKQPAIIHVGEGIDESSKHEIDQLISRNFFKRKLIGIHGVAMNTAQAESFEALVWCPESNYFLLNKTAAIHELKKHTSILFGTDSTLTGSWDIWDHIRLARKTGQLTDVELYDVLRSVGPFAINNKGNIVIAKRSDKVPSFDSFYATKPATILLVVCGEEIRLFDERLIDQLQHLDLTKFSKIYAEGVCKYIQGDLPGLMEEIKVYYPGANFPVTVS